MGDLVGIGLLILISALFAMSEIAIAASRKIKLRVMADEGNVQAAAVLKLQEQPGAFFAMIQITLNAIAILGGIVGEQALSPYVQNVLQFFYQGPLLAQISFLLSFLTITSLFILFADLLPKAFGDDFARGRCCARGNNNALGYLCLNALGIIF